MERKERSITFAVDAVSLVARTALTLIAAGRVETAGPARVAVVDSGRALVKIRARVIVEPDESVLASALVRSWRVDAQRVEAAHVRVRSTFRLALVDVCKHQNSKSRLTSLQPMLIHLNPLFLTFSSSIQ